MAPFTFLEDIVLADAAFEATGDSPSELFESAAQAVIETLVDPRTVASTWHRIIERQDDDLASLLFDWLSDIVYLKDAEGVVFRTAEAVVSQDTASGIWRLRGALAGAPIDAGRHSLRADVKAVTKHLYEVSRGERSGKETWLARVVLDI
ncbi:MAG: archease [Nitrospirae bacterium]|nr:archease [Nitrospirota bacterium]